MAFKKRKKILGAGFQTHKGAQVTINGETVTVTTRDESGLITSCYGAVIIANLDSQSDFAKGCIVVDTGAALNGFYINDGGSTSDSDFTLVGPVADGSITAAKLADSDGTGQASPMKFATIVYDFAVDTGAIGVLTPAENFTFPDNTVIYASEIKQENITTFTSALDLATIALGFVTDGDVITAVEIGDFSNPWDQGLNEFPVGDGKKLTAARSMRITIAVEAVTAGKAIFHVPYRVSE